MKTIQYPLLYYPLHDNAVLGILVGTDYQLVEKDLKRLKNSLSNYIQRQYKKHDDYWYMDIETPRLKILEVKIRPAYRDHNGSFPTSGELKIPVPVVYGMTEDGSYEAYLPLFDETIYYNEARQFRSLVHYLASDILNRMEPQQLHRLLLFAEPALDSISLRIKEERNSDNWQSFHKRTYPYLKRLTVQYPSTKSLRKKKNNLPEAAWELEQLVTEVIDQIINHRANVLLVGKHGVGKSAVLQQAMRKISQQSKKGGAALTFWQLMSQRITASAKYLGEWQESCELLVRELGLTNGILWVVDVMRLLQAGGSGAEDSVAAFFSGYLQQGQLQILSEATPQELESMRRLLPGFVEQFQLIQIDELPEDKIQTILQRLAEFAQKNLRLRISDQALNTSYRLLLRYFPYESFPGKAVKFLSQCISDAQLEQRDQIKKEDVLRNFLKQTGLPELFLRDDLLLQQGELQQYFERRIIGQPTAINKLMEVIKIFKAGLNNPEKPIATMVFAGPTGVGKTASAKVLADYFFGKGQKTTPLIRLDMSEFQYPSQVNRFIGSGREVGKLVQEIRERPFAVLLLDEIEKAAPNIFDTLLSVLDEGILVDAFGRLTSFKNAIIIMTTNLGAANRQSIGYVEEGQDETRYLSAINTHFRPEFVNRIDHVVYFQPLSKTAIRQICQKELKELTQREGFVKKELQLQFSEALVDHLSKIGFDERYGARPLQRAIDQTLINPIASWLLEHPDVEKQQLFIDYHGGLQVKIV